MKVLEKAANGVLYDANNDPEIQAEHEKALAILYKLRNADPCNKEEVEKLFKLLFGHLGNNHTIEIPFYCGFGKNIFIGDFFYANYNCTIVDNAEVIIGNHVFLAPNVSIYTAGHPLDFRTRNLGMEFAKPVTIEDNVWIGGNSTILPGVTIGHGSVIGAGSVVVKSIPPNTVAAGKPCKEIKKIDN